MGGLDEPACHFDDLFRWNTPLSVMTSQVQSGVDVRLDIIHLPFRGKSSSQFPSPSHNCRTLQVKSAALYIHD